MGHSGLIPFLGTVIFFTILLPRYFNLTEAFSSTYSAKCFSANVTQLLDSLLANYDRRIRPGHGGPATTIGVNMNVRSMGPFSEKQESYAMQLYLRHVWYDPRLKFDRALWGRSEFSMNWMFANRLWKPDTFFINGKNSYFHQITAPNMFIRLRNDGQITWSMRLTVRATCLMHLRKFPLDTQHCPLKLASYGYNAHDIVYQWLGEPNKLVTVDNDVSIAQYELVNISTHMEKVTIRRKEQISTLTVKFHLRRQTGFFLLQVYVPCILIVCCSWVAFWITKKDVPGRVGLGVTTVLSMTTLGFGGRTTGPPVSYATALDYFVILCFAFVFAAVLEFAFINFVERAVNKRRKKMEDLRRQITERITAAGTAGGSTMIVTTTLEEGSPMLKDTLRQVLKVPLSMVPQADEELSNQEEATPGDVNEGLRTLLKVPMTVLPDTPEPAKPEKEEPPSPSVEDARESFQRIFKLPLKALPQPADILRPIRRLSNAGLRSKGEGQGVSSDQHRPTDKSKNGGLENPPKPRESHKKGSRSKEDGETSTPSIIVDMSPENPEDSPPSTPSPPSPRPVTIWQLLMQKQKLMLNMAPYFVIPAEDDILDRFSVVDLYARRIFPTLFFIFIAIYWILFNYYITDEFPDERKAPSDGLVITSRL